MYPGSQAIENQIINANDVHLHAIDIDHGSRRIFARQPCGCRRFEDQIEIIPQPEPPCFHESEISERRIDLVADGKRKNHVDGGIASRRVELHRSATHEDGHDAVLRKPCSQYRKRLHAATPGIRLAGRLFQLAPQLVQSHDFGLIGITPETTASRTQPS
ncbi:MAG: hypothetical protein CSB44_10510 [Gammaproteobacteria bacterium]|nr:MAG: hypothetical protein CSB44_10510 [Gammaproteobacteria bacterium]